MKVLLNINDAYVPSITAARNDWNSRQPATVTTDANGNPLAPGQTLPNPALVTTNEAFIQLQMQVLVKGWVATFGMLPPPIVVDGVPQEVTKAQFYEELVFQSLHNIDDPALSEVEKTIALIADAVQKMRMKNAFRNSNTFERQKPWLIQLWTQLMGRTAAQLDQTFVNAAQR